MVGKSLVLSLFSAAVVLGACGDEKTAGIPPPAELTRDAVGYYCNMIVADHPGPKGQVRLAGREEPVWFSSVRDTIAFTRLPEEPKDIAAVYVNDMTAFEDWSSPPDRWIPASDAWYVIGSEKRGGMGAPEPVPFAGKADAQGFAERFGGRFVAYSEIPDEAILGTADMESANAVRADGQATRSGEDANHADH